MTPSGGSDAARVLAGLRAPLANVLAEYLAARAELDRIIDALSAALGEPAALPDDHEPAPAASPADRAMRIEVRGGDIAHIIDFQERLALVADVSRVSVVGLDHGRATLIVELGEPDDPTVICIGCGKTLVAGGRHQSHGLCDPCASAFKAQRRVSHQPPPAPADDQAAARFA